jgi:hypothetical protein
MQVTLLSFCKWLGEVGLPAVWDRSQPFSRLKLGSVKALRLTQRAAEVWESARFLGVCVALDFFRFDSESSLRPASANASR